MEAWWGLPAPTFWDHCPQPPELCPKQLSRDAPRNMGEIFFAPISECQAPTGTLTLLVPVRRVSTPQAGIIIINHVLLLSAWNKPICRSLLM